MQFLDKIHTVFTAALNRFPDADNMGQQYNVEEKPTVILYIYINPHVGTPEKY